MKSEEKTRVMRLSDGKTFGEIFSHFVKTHKCDRQTDRQTDRQLCNNIM